MCLMYRITTRYNRNNRLKKGREVRAINVAIFLVLVLFLAISCREDMSPIHDAIVVGSIDKVKDLVAKGADVNGADAKGRTTLYWAALIGSKDIAEYLISEGAQIDKGASWKDNNTPLHVASEKGHTDVVALLLDKGANVNCVNRVRQTPLHLAAWRGNSKTVNYLLSYGADTNVKDKRGHTPLHVEDIDRRAGSDYTKRVELLIAAGADVNARADVPEGYTPLMGACIIGSKEVVELLISHGADVNARSSELRTPLGLAIAYGRKEIETVLREHGAKETKK